MEKPPGSQWRLNVGRALDVLRRDVAGLFSRRNYTPDFSIYSPEIEDWGRRKQKQPSGMSEISNNWEIPPKFVVDVT